MTDKARRQFLTRSFFRMAGRILRNFEEGVEAGRQEDDFNSFFESYESSYALTLAYPDDILMETARKHGIQTEGRSKNEIVKELFQKQGGFENRQRSLLSEQD